MKDSGCSGPEPPEASRSELFPQATHSGYPGRACISQPLVDNERDLGGHRSLNGRCRGGKNTGTGRPDHRSSSHWTAPVATRSGCQMVSRMSGVQIVMGAGYLSSSPIRREYAACRPHDIADEVCAYVSEGVPGKGVRAGIIGEIGIDLDLHRPREEKNLRGARRARGTSFLRYPSPCMCRRPTGLITNAGSARHGHRRRRGRQLGAHNHATMCRSIRAASIARSRSPTAAPSWLRQHLQFLHWGMRGRGPTDEESAADIKRLIDAGYLRHILLSHDIHLKIMLTAYGGWGYAYILKTFGSTSTAVGVTDEQIHVMLVDNPRRLFSSRYRRAP